MLAPGRGAFVAVFGADCFRERALAGFLARDLDARATLVARWAGPRALTWPAAGCMRCVQGAAGRRALGRAR